MSTQSPRNQADSVYKTPPSLAIRLHDVGVPDWASAFALDVSEKTIEREIAAGGRRQRVGAASLIPKRRSPRTQAEMIEAGLYWEQVMGTLPTARDWNPTLAWGDGAGKPSPETADAPARNRWDRWVDGWISAPGGRAGPLDPLSFPTASLVAKRFGSMDKFRVALREEIARRRSTGEEYAAVVSFPWSRQTSGAAEARDLANEHECLAAGSQTSFRVVRGVEELTRRTATLLALVPDRMARLAVKEMSRGRRGTALIGPPDPMMGERLATRFGLAGEYHSGKVLVIESGEDGGALAHRLSEDFRVSFSLEPAAPGRRMRGSGRFIGVAGESTLERRAWLEWAGKLGKRATVVIDCAEDVLAPLTDLVEAPRAPQVYAAWTPSGAALDAALFRRFEHIYIDQMCPLAAAGLFWDESVARIVAAIAEIAPGLRRCDRSQLTELLAKIEAPPRPRRMPASTRPPAQRRVYNYRMREWVSLPRDRP